MTDPAPSGSVPPELAVSHQAPDRNLALDLVRVTEAAAMAAGRWVGLGDKNGGDGAAVDAMRTLIGTVSMHGVITIALLSGGTETVTLDVTVDVNDVPWARISGTDNGIAVRHADGSELSSAESQAFGNLFGLPRAIEFAIESLFSPCQRLMGA